MIQGFVDAIATGYLKDSIESDIESYGLNAYLQALKEYLEAEHDSEETALLLEAIANAMEKLESLCEG